MTATCLCGGIRIDIAAHRPGRLVPLLAVRRVLWDPQSRELSIVYDRDLDGMADRASEVLAFGPIGLVVRGEVFYGVVA